MRWKRFGAGLAAAGTLGTTGLFAADAKQNPYEDKGTHYELDLKPEIDQGERVEIAKDKAAMTLRGWNDEYAITIVPQIPTISFGAHTQIDRPFTVEADRKFLSKKMEYRSGDVTAFIEPKEATENEFDIDFTLHSKPETNVFTYKIDGAEEFDWHYQPPLTDQEIAEGAQRPDNVVGSYAVYHRTRANHRVGSTNYATGKVFHVYRPKAIDAEGAEKWCDLNYEGGLLTVNCSEQWLAKATYPITIDPTFGKGAIGASNFAATSDQILCLRGTSPAEAGTLTEISYYNKTGTGTQTVKGLLYASSTRALVATGSENTINTTAQWATSTASASITAQTYLICSFFNANATNNFRYYYDAVANSQALETIITYPTPDDPITPNVYSTSQHSIYATYTASGGGGNGATPTDAKVQIMSPLEIQTAAIIQ